MKIIITDRLPDNFLSYDAVIVGETAYHSRRVKLPQFQGTKWYCHTCFATFESQEEWEKHTQSHS